MLSLRRKVVSHFFKSTKELYQPLQNGIWRHIHSLVSAELSVSVIW